MRSHSLAGLIAASIVGASGCAHGPTDNYGHVFGVASLVPGQAQKVWIGAGYPLLRVCIDLQTTGSAVITIDDQQPKTLRPGLCTEDYGSTIEMSNHDAGTATVVYRAIFEPPPP